MSNSNFLRGIACPQCGADDYFQITGRVTFDVTNNGSEAIGDHHWDDESTIKCAACLHVGTVKEFSL